MEDDIELLLTEGKTIRRNRRLRTFLLALGNALFVGFLFLTKLGLERPLKYLLSSASIPLEVINVIVQIKNLWDKQKPLWTFFMVFAIGLGNVAFLAITDAVKWGGWTSGVLATIAASGSILFTGIMTLYGTLNLVNCIKHARRMYQKPYLRTPLMKLGLVTEAAKAGSFFVLAALMVPFSLAIGTNPVGASIFIGFISAALVTLVVVKIVKTVRENKAWEKTIAENTCDPYELLGVDKATLAAIIKAEDDKKHPFIIKFKIQCQTSWLSFFGTEEEKKAIAVTKKDTPEKYIESCYKNTLMPARKDVKRIESLITQQQKKLDKITPEWWAVIEALTEDLVHAKAQYKTEKETVRNHPQLALLKDNYDLLRKSRGRLKYEEIEKSRKRKLLNNKLREGAIKRQRETSNPLAGLTEEMYAQLYSPGKSASKDLTHSSSSFFPSRATLK